jgi:hypothetical protein
MRALFIIFVFSCFFTDCASKGRVSPLTYRLDVDDDLNFELDTKVCDLSTLKVELKPFDLSSFTSNNEINLDYSPGGDKRLFSQELEYSLYCQDSLKEDENGKDLLDTLFEYYRDEIFPDSIDEELEISRKSFFIFVRFFQKILLKTYSSDDSDVSDRLKLEEDDLVLNSFFSKKKIEGKNRVTAEVKRNFWTNHKFPFVNYVTGTIETKGFFTIEKSEEGKKKSLVVTYESQGEPTVSGSTNIIHLKNTKKITERVKMTYTPSEDKDKPNFIVTVKRADVAIKPSMAPEGNYKSASKDFFEEIIFSSAIHHFSHFGRYLVRQTPTGLRGLMYGQLMSSLKRVAKVVKKENPLVVSLGGDSIEIVMERSDRWKFKSSKSEKTLTMDVGIAETSFSSKKGESFSVSMSISQGIDKYWSSILGAKAKEEDQLNRPIKVEDGSLKLGLVRKRTLLENEKSYDWILLSRHFLVDPLRKEMKKSQDNKVKVTHNPNGLEIEFKEANKLLFKEIKTNKEYLFKYEIDEQKFIEKEKSFALILTYSDENSSDKISSDLIKNLGLDHLKNKEYKSYIKLDSKDGLLLQKKNGNSWSSIFLTKDTPYEWHDEFEAIKEALEKESFSGTIQENGGKDSYSFVVSLDKIEIKFIYNGFFKENLIIKSENFNEKTLSANYKIDEGSYDPKDKSFKMILTYKAKLEQPFVSKFGQTDKIDNSPWKIKLEDDRLSLKRNYNPEITFQQVIRDEWILLEKVKN